VTAACTHIGSSHCELALSPFMDTETFKTARTAILANARSLLRAAEKLAGEDVDHVRYHLAALCLEEVGKVSLVGMRFMAGLTDTEASLSVEDHVKKLFWAIWGPSFGREPLTREQIEQHRALATNIHDKRLFSLYADPDVPLLPSEKIKREEADNLVGMAPKLAELGNARAWIGWLREVYQDHDVKMQTLIQKEINRTPASDRKSAKPKWRIKFRIYSHSHSIRQKALNVWNERTDFIRLNATGERRFSKNKKDEIVATINLGDSVPVGALWHFGWGIARSLVIALNIGTRGVFWWYVPSDTEGWYDEIWDVENNAGVRITEGPKLEIGWGNRVLTDNDIAHTAIMFRYIAACRGTPKEGPLNAYTGGVVFLSKLDFHWRCELDAFEQFWTCFQETLRASGYWDGESDLKAAATAALQEALSDTSELQSHIDLGIRLDAAMPKPEGLRGITLTEVIGMKLYCDLLLLKDAVKSLEKDTAATYAFTDAVEILGIIEVLEAGNKKPTEAINKAGAGRAASHIQRSLFTRLHFLVARTYGGRLRPTDRNAQMAFELLKDQNIAKEMHQGDLKEAQLIWDKCCADPRLEPFMHFRDKFLAHHGTPVPGTDIPTYGEVLAIARETTRVLEKLAHATGVVTLSLDSQVPAQKESAEKFWAPWTKSDGA